MGVRVLVDVVLGATAYSADVASPKLIKVGWAGKELVTPATYEGLVVGRPTRLLCRSACLLRLPGRPHRSPGRLYGVVDGLVVGILIEVVLPTLDCPMFMVIGNTVIWLLRGAGPPRGVPC